MAMGLEEISTIRQENSRSIGHKEIGKFEGEGTTGSCPIAAGVGKGALSSGRRPRRKQRIVCVEGYW